MTRTSRHDILSPIKTRFANRALTGEQVSRQDLEAMVEAASFAPSCFNEQPWRFLIAQGELGPVVIVDNLLLRQDRAEGLMLLMPRLVRFDADGQMLTATFMDYALPRAADIPNFHFETRNVRCVTNALGVKGAGEAGAIGACPAVMNAMVDALHRAAGIKEIDMPATPLKVFHALRDAAHRA